METELHAELGDAGKRRGPSGAPGRRGAIPLAKLLQRLDLTQEIGIPGEALTARTERTAQQPWILRPFQHFIQLSPDRVAGVIPCPMRIERERLEALPMAPAEREVGWLMLIAREVLRMCLRSIASCGPPAYPRRTSRCTACARSVCRESPVAHKPRLAQAPGTRSIAFATR